MRRTSMLQRAFLAGHLGAAAPGNPDDFTSETFKAPIQRAINNLSDEDWTQFCQTFDKWVQADTEVFGNETSPIKFTNDVLLSDILQCCDGIGCDDDKCNPATRESNRVGASNG